MLQFINADIFDKSNNWGHVRHYQAMCAFRTDKGVRACNCSNSFSKKDAALSLIGASLSEPHLVCCMAEVPVAMFVCL